jgi:phage baseplate assembly protein W
MAYNAQKISPVNFSPSVGVGINLPFNGNAVFKETFTTKDAIKNNLINWFLTNRGERPLNPEFGGNLRQYIFEQINNNTLDFLEEDLQAQIANYFPSIIVESLDLLSTPDRNQITINLKYSIQGTNSNDQINISFN